MRVGLAWAGSPQHKNDANRSIPFDLWRPVFEVPGIEPISLMHPSHLISGAWQGTPWSLTTQTPLLADHDFAEAARIVRDLDLVITVDTAIGHLAGGMGKPCWLLLAASPDFRWGLSGTDSPWYPTHRLYRQHKANDWDVVLRTVAEDLFTHNQQAA